MRSGSEKSIAEDGDPAHDVRCLGWLLFREVRRVVSANQTGVFYGMNSAPLFSDRLDLATDRLILRRPNYSDVDAIVKGVGLWEVARRLARVPYPYGPDDARFFLDKIVPAEWVWAVTLRGSDVLLGTIGLTPEAGADTAELGYWLIPAQWGKGIATEAARAVVAFGFKNLGLSVITSGFFEDNPASGRVLHKLGFIETRRVMRPCLAAGASALSVRMKLSRPA